MATKTTTNVNARTSAKLDELVTIAGTEVRPLTDTETLGQIEARLREAIGGFNTLGSAADRLKQYIGRLMIAVRDRELWHGQYKNFSDWYTRKVVGEMGFKRTYVLDALKLVTSWPSLTPAQVAQYGISNLLEAAKVTDETKPEAKEILGFATRFTVEQFRDKVRELRGMPTEPAQPQITVRLSAEAKEWWNAQLEASGKTSGEFFEELRSAWTSIHAPASRRPAQRTAHRAGAATHVA